MKTLYVAVVGMLLASALACRGQATAYPVKLSGGVIRQDQSGTATKISFGKKWLAGTDNRLVLVVDVDLHEMRLVSVDSDTNLVETLAESIYFAILPNGVFNGVLEFFSLTIDSGLFSIDGEGAILVRGKLRTNASTGDPLDASGSLEGVLNDSTSGNIVEPDTLIKAKILPAGNGFDADEFGL